MFRTGRVSAAIGIGVAAMLLLSACAPSPDDAHQNASAQSGAATSTVESTAQASDPATPHPPGAADAFRAWLDASRVPDTAASCAALSPELATRMVAELNERGPVHVSSCDDMIAVTAELYRALGQDAQVDIAVQHETATDATLFVTYLASGDCGTVVMTRPTSDWTITDQSRECAG